MGIDPIGGIDKSIPGYDRASKAYQNSGVDQQPGQVKSKKIGDPVSVSLQRASSTMGKLATVNEDKNLFATNVRLTDKALQEISGVMDKMKVHLDTIVKNWPPFPQESEQRKEILMSYASLRKEILKMTVPLPPTQVYEKNTRLWDNLGYTDNQELARSVPDITPASTDEQVKKASIGLAEAQSAVSAGRDELVRMVSE